MIHTHYDMVITIEEAIDILLNSIQKHWSVKLCFIGSIVTLKYIDYIALEIYMYTVLCIEIDGCYVIMVHQCFVMKFIGMLRALHARILIMVYFLTKVTPFLNLLATALVK